MRPSVFAAILAALAVGGCAAAAREGGQAAAPSLSGVPDLPASASAEGVMAAINMLFGIHPGARAAHATGIVAEGRFTPDPGAAGISRALHFAGGPLRATVRFSNFAGIPGFADNQPMADPRGMAVKFHLADGRETDVVTRSVAGFPAANTEDFRRFLIAVASSRGAAQPTPLQIYLAGHPEAATFLARPKPAPVSFATQAYYEANAFAFANAAGEVRYGRYRWLPDAGGATLSADQAAAMSADYLRRELAQRLARETVGFRLFVQIAAPGDPLHDPSALWPDDRAMVELGRLTIDRLADDNGAAEAVLAFRPDALVDGIVAEDPMIAARGAAYDLSRQRRQSVPDQRN